MRTVSVPSCVILYVLRNKVVLLYLYNPLLYRTEIASRFSFQNVFCVRDSFRSPKSSMRHVKYPRTEI